MLRLKQCAAHQCCHYPTYKKQYWGISSILNQGDKEPALLLPSHRGLKLASLNINKLATHIDELRIFLAHNEIDILSIDDTKLNETISDNKVNILGYDIVRRDRTTDGGEGVYFYSKKSQ